MGSAGQQNALWDSRHIAVRAMASSVVSLEAHNQSLVQRSLRGLKWNYIGTLGRIAAQLASQIILARLLGPETFGLFGYAVLAIGISTLIVEMGLGAALVQTKTFSREEFGTIVARLVIAAGSVATALFLGADSIARWVFDTPDVAPVIKVISSALLLGAIGVPATAMLRRELRFKDLQLTQLVSYLIGYLIVGIAIAWAGGGVWSLVAAWLTQLAIASLIVNLLVPGSLRWSTPLRPLKVTRFGLTIMLTNLVNWTVDNTAHLLIGRWYGASALGLFSVANNLVRTPANHLTISLQTVLFPASARTQHDPVLLARAYLAALAGVALLSFPLFMFVAMEASAIVDVLLGGHWSAAAAILTPLALAMIAHALMAVSGPMLSGKGEPALELAVQSASAIAIVIAMWLAARVSLGAMVWALCGVYFLRALTMTAAIVSRLSIRWAQIARAVSGGALLALVVIVVDTVTAIFLRAQTSTMSPATHLFVDLCMTMAISVAALLLWPVVWLNQPLAAVLRHLLKPNTAWWRLPFFARIRANLATMESR